MYFININILKPKDFKMVYKQVLYNSNKNGH